MQFPTNASQGGGSTLRTLKQKNLVLLLVLWGITNIIALIPRLAIIDVIIEGKGSIIALIGIDRRIKYLHYEKEIWCLVDMCNLEDKKSRKNFKGLKSR